ncbi:MAG: hypothetical protein ACC619_01405 [Paracoccaceae bacterium]
MTNDFLLVLGIILAILSVPAMISAYASSQKPRSALVMLVLGGGLISWAVYQQPNTYSLDGLPELFVSVLANLIR